MGEARRRGTFEERKALAVDRAKLKAEAEELIKESPTGRSEQSDFAIQTLNPILLAGLLAFDYRLPKVYRIERRGKR